ncbi:MAG TPA: hypothetical protein VHE35_02100, partial [Kofleriaceae bacterium]|nr:hypothetical protein [Kofleriaceae bacterium]
MPVTSLDILDALARVVTRGVKLHALADDLGLKKQEYAALRSLLADLAASGQIQILSGGAFALAPQGRPADRRARQPALPWTPPAEPVKEVAAEAPAPAAPVRKERARRVTAPPPVAD